MIQFTVWGAPRPQGSTRAFVVKGRPIVTSSNKNLADWRRLVSDAAQQHARMHDGAVVLRLYFGLPRPKSLPKKVLHHLKKPDLDKLIRSVCDSLTGIMWNDDSQVVSITASKVYSHRPGVVIAVGEAGEQCQTFDKLNATPVGTNASQEKDRPAS